MSTIKRLQPWGIRRRKKLHAPWISDVVSLVLTTILALPGLAMADDSPSQIRFNATFLRGNQAQGMDLSHFEKGQVLLPGNYGVDLMVNQEMIGHSVIHFDQTQNTQPLSACIDHRVIAQLPINLSKSPAQSQKTIATALATDCLPLESLLPGLKIDFDVDAMALRISIPQIYLSRNVSGYVPPALWDEGITSATLAYQLNEFSTHSNGMSQSSQFLGTRMGLNLGSWHMRSQLTWSVSPQDTRQFQFQNAYIEHDLPELTSRIRIGEIASSGMMFDSFQLRGGILESDDRMLPDAERGYAPVIRGVARSYARVRVTQNGNLLQEITVAPGEFIIDDLYPASYGGELLVTIFESNGARESFTVPFSTNQQLLREGSLRYSLLAGQAYAQGMNYSTPTLQATVRYGLNDWLTGYTGATASTGYLAEQLGMAINSSVGAFSADLTRSRAILSNGNDSVGQSRRLAYSKYIRPTKTQVMLANYQYKSEGYWSLPEILNQHQFSMLDNMAVHRPHSKLQVSLHQNLGQELGSLYVSGSNSSYWNQSGKISQYQVGYTRSLILMGQKISANILLARQHDDVNGTSRSSAMASIVIPTSSTSQASLMHINSNDSGTVGQSSQATISGTATEDGLLNYQFSTIERANASHYSIGGGYRANSAQLSGNLSQGPGYTQKSISISGGMILHEGGLTLANQMNDTAALIDAQGAEGAKIGFGTRVDSQGYAVYPNVFPYRKNPVHLQPESATQEVELDTTSVNVIPRANAVVRAKFKARSGTAVIFQIKLSDEKTAPYGTSILDNEEHELGIVGQLGRAYVRTTTEQGKLIARWGPGNEAQCEFSYELPKAKNAAKQAATPVTVIEVQCTAVAASRQRSTRLATR